MQNTKHKKIVLVALNARYTHTNIAVRTLAAYVQSCGGVRPSIAEFSINMPFDTILAQLSAHAADAYIFSCYIWNIEQVKQLVCELKKLCPSAFIGLGGPQVSHGVQAILQNINEADGVFYGEGEWALAKFYAELQTGQPLQSFAGFMSRCDITEQAPPPAVEINELPFAYMPNEPLQGRQLYYESMRGCPFACSYCCSGAKEQVRYKSLPKVYDELQRFFIMAQDGAQKRIKFVDRTFNANPQRALEIWQYLAQQDNGSLSFHFEIQASLITQQQLDFLATVRSGLFQFEIGVQSTNEQTLTAVQRSPETQQLFKNAAALRKAGNIHLHLDLIAGLPHEDYASFANSFNSVYALAPHQLQLGFLKLLEGSALQRQAQSFGIVCQSRAPFEVLYTNSISYPELCRLKLIAELVETYYNSGRFTHLVRHMVAQHQTPFAFFEALANHLEQSGRSAREQSQAAQYQLLGSFAQSRGELTEQLQWLCRLDLALHERPRVRPAWVLQNGALPRRLALIFYQDSQNISRYLPHLADMQPSHIEKICHIERFACNPYTGEAGEYCLLFDYTRRTPEGHAVVHQIQLPIGEQ